MLENLEYTKSKMEQNNKKISKPAKVKRIGIECHNLENSRFGVGQTLAQLLEEISQAPGIAEKFEFYLYFKKEIPKDKILKSPIFHKKIIKIPFLFPSFAVFYHFLIPLYYYLDKLDGFFFPGYMMPALFAGKSAVVLTNDVFYETIGGNLPWRFKLSYRIFARQAAKKANKIITLSKTAKNDLVKLYKIPEEKIEVAPWGLNKKLFNPRFDKNAANGIKKKYSIKNNFIFSWGQAFPRRHIKEAILAFAKIANDFPSCQYFVACADKYNPPILENLAEKINSELKREAIVYKKYIEDQAELFYLINEARLIIYISSNEAMGLPPIEALCLKTPSVVADNDLTREIFADSAFFVKNMKNTDEIALAIKEGILNENRRNKIIGSSESVVKKFSWQKNLQLLLAIFDKIF